MRKKKILSNLNSNAERFAYCFTTFCLLCLPFLFYYLNNIQPYYFTDEKFHIPQAIQYCQHNFFEWDPKITTLPGLYLFSALLLSPIGLCAITYLRLINLLCTYINFYLLYQIIKNNGASCAINCITALNLILFPPLFFYFFLYYTDTFSLTLVLLTMLLQLHGKNRLAATVGALSIIARQTNVIWVALCGAEKALEVVEKVLKNSESMNSLNIFNILKQLLVAYKKKSKKGDHCKFIKFLLAPTFPYFIVLLGFAIFVLYNKGIVVGDKSAHIPVIHITQLFYCAAFFACFSWPYLITYVKEFLFLVSKNIILMVNILLIATLIIYYNTLEHPYLLADNRHFSFYIWKKIMKRNEYSKYLLVPIYTFSLFAIYKCLIKNIQIMAVVIYGLCVSVVLIPQLLLEPRYFIMPYVLFRLRLNKNVKIWQIIMETTTTVIVNILQFYVFSTKTFPWKDEQHPQRIGW